MTYTLYTVNLRPRTMKYLISSIKGIDDLFTDAPDEFKKSPKELRGLKSLYRELSPESTLNWTSLERFLWAGNVLIIATTNNGRPVGMASLVIMTKLSCRNGRVEDVVVAKRHRKKGIARRMMLEVRKQAKLKSLRWLELTSKPDRVAANLLYRSLGYGQRETNVYRLSL